MSMMSTRRNYRVNNPYTVSRFFSHVPRPISLRRSFNSFYRPYGRGSYRNKFNLLNGHTNPVRPRPEVKYLDTNIGVLGTPAPIANDGSSIASINNPTTGTSSNQRIGAQLAIKSCYYQFVLNFGTTTAPIVLRHMLIWDRQSNGANAAVTDILSNPNAYVASPMNLQNRERFVVLADDRITLSPNGEMIHFCNDFRKINQKSTYSGSNQIATTGNLLVFFVSDEPTGDTVPTVYGTWRVRYYDN